MLTEKLYGEPESYDVSPENVAEYINDPEFLYSDNWRDFSLGVNSEVRGSMVNERVDVNERWYKDTFEGLGIFGGGSSGFSTGSNGISYMLDLPRNITPPQSTSLTEVIEKLAPELSEPSVGGIILGAGIGIYLGNKLGGEAGEFVPDFLEDSYRNIEQEQFNDDFYAEVNLHNWEEYREELLEELDADYTDEILE